MGTWAYAPCGTAGPRPGTGCCAGIGATDTGVAEGTWALAGDAVEALRMRGEGTCATTSVERMLSAEAEGATIGGGDG